MMESARQTCSSLAVGAWAALALTAVTSGQGPTIERPNAQPSTFNWSQAETVYTARLLEVEAGPVARSFPPIYTYRLTIQVDDVIRGDTEPEEHLKVSYRVRQEQPPTFLVGKMYLLAVRSSREQLIAERLTEATDSLLTEVVAACTLPLGWTMQGDRVLSPWVQLGDNAWAVKSSDTEVPCCSVTGRPAYATGSVARLDVAAVPPKESIKWTNPDGDGEYCITVSNPSNEPIQVPSLLVDSETGNILWSESLVVLCQGKAYPCPESRGVQGPVAAAELAPGQSISTTVNALRLQGPKWPRGGYRIEFQFCLGEKSETKSFYYLSRHHDAIREAAR